MPEHFAAAPGWGGWIVAYFFFGGIAGGSYAIGTLVRRVGSEADQPIARRAFIVSFLALVTCPILLIADLGQPARFLNLLIDAGEGGVVFKYWSPISLGSWVLFGFGLFSFVSFLGALGEGTVSSLSGPARALRGGAGFIWNVIGTVFGLFIAGYTGVVLAASNVVVWSDAAWVLGGLFIASGLAGSAALLLFIGRLRRDLDAGASGRLETADRNFAILEALLIVGFLASVAVAGAIGTVLGVWLVLWAVVVVGVAAPFVVARMDRAGLVSSALVMLGVLALRALVVFSAQA